MLESGGAALQEILQAGLIVAGYDSQEGGQVFGLPLGGTLVKVPFAIGRRLCTTPFWGFLHSYPALHCALLGKEGQRLCSPTGGNWLRLETGWQHSLASLDCHVWLASSAAAF